MDVVESIRYAMRKRIAGNIIDISEYQREGYDAPKEDSCYIRETVMEMSREEDSQASELVTVLCEYDVFVRKKDYSNVTAKLSDVASKILDEFNIKNPSKIDIDISEWGSAKAWVSSYNYESISQEEELWRLPVMIYVEARITSGN